MEIYQVGGSVRDEILGHKPIDKDWVVVGSSPEEMEAKGFNPIGKDFPVFLHPTSNEEYALARTEKKIAKGYKGFKFYCSPDITLEEDLIRRDLTINSIAKDSNGKIIDPCNGSKDIAKKSFEIPLMLLTRILLERLELLDFLHIKSYMTLKFLILCMKPSRRSCQKMN